MSGISLGRIVAEITANTAGLRRGAADAERILNDTSNNASAAGKAIGVAFAVTAALGVMKLIDKLEDCTQVAIDNKKALMGLESVAKAYGVSVDDATKATKDFTQDGLLQMKSATTGMKNILSTGFNVSEAMKLSQALKDIGAFNNVTGDLGQAYEDVTKGMRTGSIELIENIGLTQKLSAVMKAANIDISNGIDLTNNAAQREAFYNMVLKEGEKFKGNAAKLADDQAASQAKANAAIKEAADAIGNRLLPTYSALMDTISSLSKIATDVFKETEFDKVTDKIIDQKTQLGMLSATYLNLKDKVNKTSGEQEAYNTAISELQRIYPDYLKNLDLNNMKTETAKNLLSQLNDEMDIKFIKMQAEAANADLYKQSTEELKKEVAATFQLNKLLAEKAEWEKSDRYKQGFTRDYATPIKYYQKIKDEAVKNQGEIQNSIKKTEDFYEKVLETAQNRRKKYFFEPTNIYDTNNPDSPTYMLQTEKKGKTPKVKITPEIEITDPEPSWIEVQNLIYGQFAKIEPEIKPVFNLDNMEIAKQQLAVGLTDFSKYQTTFAQQGTGGISKIAAGLMDLSNYGVVAVETSNNVEYVNKTLNDVTKSFSELAGVLDNEVISAISNIANEAMSMSSNIEGFSAAQGAEDTLGMLSSGIGMFSSAVSIFQVVGGLFSDSTNNFDASVEKMLKWLGEKTPDVQVKEYQKALDLSNALKDAGVTNTKYITKEQYDKLKAQGIDVKKEFSSSQGLNFYSLSKDDQTLLANLQKIIPQLAEQLGTAAGDFGSAIGSALSSATTSEELKANLYDSIYGTVKSGLINAFLAGEVMKPLLNRLQETVTLAVASGGIDGTEKEAIQALLGDVGIKTDEFYSALEAVGLNVVDAAGQLNEAANRMDNVNRNLRLADRISTITTQSGTIGIPPLLSGGSVVYDFSNANLGGMTEQQVISAVSKAKRIASIKRTGV